MPEATAGQLDLPWPLGEFMAKLPREQDQTKLFVIRLWPESFEGAQRVWRGQVVHTADDAKRYFARWAGLLRFLCKELGVEWEGHVESEIITEVMQEESK